MGEGIVGDTATGVAAVGGGLAGGVGGAALGAKVGGLIGLG